MPKIQQELKTFYSSRIIPVIQEELDRIDDGSIVRIERLTVELDHLFTADFEDELLTGFRKELQKQLNSIHWNTKEQLSESVAKHTINTAEIIIEKTTIAAVEQEVVHYFLLTGSLPWYAKAYKHTSITTLLLSFLKNKNPSFLTFLVRHASVPSFIERLSWQFSDKIHHQIIKKLAPVQANIIIVLLNEMQQWATNSSTETQIQKATHLVTKNVLQAVLQRKIHNIQEAAKHLIEVVYREMGDTFWVVLKTYLSKMETQNKCPHKLLPFLLHETLSQLSINTIKKQKMLKALAHLLLKHHSSVKYLLQHGKIFEKQEHNPKNTRTNNAINIEVATKTIAKKNEHAEYYYISNAGLVILWPYLELFFERCRLLEDKKFVSNESAFRAIHLLCFLTSGEENIAEHQLIFNKVLCGFSPSTPIPLEVHLTTAEKNGAMELLNAVIQNSVILKNTSPNGFRTAFLMREGKLSATETHWLLNVKGESYDMVLEKIPWNIRTFKLSWMDKPIYTIW